MQGSNCFEGGEFSHRDAVVLLFSAFYSLPEWISRFFLLLLGVLYSTHQTSCLKRAHKRCTITHILLEITQPAGLEEGSVLDCDISLFVVHRSAHLSRLEHCVLHFMPSSIYLYT
jgi:hypothetical protein